MPFEKRRNSAATYYYFSDRLRPRAKKRYVGSSRDPIARLIALFHQQELEQLQEVRAKIREEIRKYRELDAQLRRLATRVRRHFRVEVLLQGFCLYQGKLNMIVPMTSRTELPEQQPGELTWDYVARLRARANGGDEAALAKLRDVLREHPELWHQTGDILAAGRETLLGLLAPQDALAREAIREHLQAHGRQLEAEGDGTALEKLLIDHLMLTMLQVEVTRLGLNGSRAPLARKGDARFWDERHQSASKRFAESARLLQDVRSAALQQPGQPSRAAENPTHPRPVTAPDPPLAH